MKIAGLIISIALWSLNAFTSEHPLKMSSSKLVISSDGNVELKTRIFLDDLTDHIEKLYNIGQPDFSTTKSNGVQALQGYLSDHFYFEQDGKKINLMINGVLLSKNRLALEVHMNTSDKLDTSKEVLLVNTLLCDTFPLQTNDISYSDQHYLLSLGNPKVKIQIH